MIFWPGPLREVLVIFSDILTKKLFVILGSEMYHNNNIVGKKMEHDIRLYLICPLMELNHPTCSSEWYQLIAGISVEVSALIIAWVKEVTH